MSAGQNHLNIATQQYVRFRSGSTTPISDNYQTEQSYWFKIIDQVQPGLSDLDKHILGDGFDSIAVDIGGKWIFKFPKHAAAEARLLIEERVLSIVREHVVLKTPQTKVFQAPVIFSMHAKIQGRSLEKSEYLSLSNRDRDQIAESLATFHFQMHGIDCDTAKGAGFRTFPTPLKREFVEALLKQFLSGAAKDAAFSNLKLHEMSGEDLNVPGHFDSHGWNMAYDSQTRRLNGIYDIGDACIGPLHCDLNFSGFVSSDLTRRIVKRYNSLGRHQADIEEVLRCHSVLRYHELAKAEIDQAFYVKRITDWHEELDV